jgi:DNA-binding MarR family transcriptional regulator
MDEAVAGCSRDDISKPVLEIDVYTNLVRAQELLYGADLRFFAAWGLTPQQYNVLRILYFAETGEAGLPCSAIGERLFSRVPDVTRLLDRIEQAGWITRHRIKEDRRVVMVRLSSAGRDLVERVDAPLKEHHIRAFAGLSRRQLETLNQLLVQLLKAGEDKCSDKPEANR